MDIHRFAVFYIDLYPGKCDGRRVVVDVRLQFLMEHLEFRVRQYGKEGLRVLDVILDF